MSGYIGSDGSALAGALNPSSVIQGLNIDALGGLRISDALRALVINGQVYSASIKASSAVATAVGVSFFNINTNLKNKLIVGIQGASQGNNGWIDVRTGITSDPALTGGVLTPGNLKAGGANSELNAAGITYQNTAITPVGNIFISKMFPGQTIIDMLVNGECILLPAGSSQGIEIIVNQGALGVWTCAVQYIEF